MDEGTQVHVDQSQVGSGVGLFAVCQQVVSMTIRLRRAMLCLTVAEHCRYLPLLVYDILIVQDAVTEKYISHSLIMTSLITHTSCSRGMCRVSSCVCDLVCVSVCSFSNRQTV